MILSSHSNRSWRAIVTGLLALALLLGQSLAHGHDHDAGQDTDEACALCLFAQQSGNSIASTADGLSVQTSRVHSACTPVQHAVAVTIPPFHSRAPPFISC